jgi:hypothetical protein
VLHGREDHKNLSARPASGPWLLASAPTGGLQLQGLSVSSASRQAGKAEKGRQRGTY